jgi:hypothetical protein
MFPAKKTFELKRNVLEAAAGSSGRHHPEKRPVVEFSAGGTSSKAGPAAASYEKCRPATKNVEQQLDVIWSLMHSG